MVTPYDWCNQLTHYSHEFFWLQKKLDLFKIRLTSKICGSSQLEIRINRRSPCINFRTTQPQRFSTTTNIIIRKQYNMLNPIVLTKVLSANLLSSASLKALWRSKGMPLTKLVHPWFKTLYYHHHLNDQYQTSEYAVWCYFHY